jgi:hypothetical protein
MDSLSSLNFWRWQSVQVRRERISDRLKALQLLVPNGDKVGSLKKSTRARITTNF